MLVHLYSMAGKYLRVNLHMVWSTKGWRRLINREWAHRLYAYMGGIAESHNARLIAAGGQPDHIHLYIFMPSTITIAELINALKANSSRWIHQTFPNLRIFSWQEGYAAFSVSKSSEKPVIEYIHNQEEHHKRIDFRQEIIDLLDLHQIDYDLRYLFD
jgi:putative transposase